MCDATCEACHHLLWGIAHLHVWCISWHMPHLHARCNHFLWDITMQSFRVRHDSFTCAMHPVRPASFTCNHVVWDMTMQSLRLRQHESHPWAMQSVLVRHDSSIRETWLIDTWDMTHLYCEISMISCHISQEMIASSWVMSHSIDESCLTYRWVMSHTKWLQGHAWDMNLSDACLTHDLAMRCNHFVWDMTHLYVRHDSSILWDTTHRYVRHDSFLRETWLIYMWDMTHCTPDTTHLFVGHASSTRETWLVCTWDMTHALVCLDSFIRVTWLIHVCVTWLVHMCDKKKKARR